MKGPTQPYDMSSEHWERVRRLPSAVRDRVLERACVLIYASGYAPDVADRMALEQEAGVRL